ncbi:MAG: cytochrome C biogenesis protein [Saprospiraceae bacterium]|nr:cytochrome C biogenesis protein [Saprospiraceae bacterium]
MTVLIIFFSTLFSDLIGQKNSPVNWTFSINKISESDYEITATAKMNPSWVIYSQFTDDAGPIPTFFLVDGKESKFEEKSKVIKEFDEMFDVDVMKFKDTAVFTQKIKKSDKSSVTGSVEFMTCDGTRCLPPAEVTFDLKF